MSEPVDMDMNLKDKLNASHAACGLEGPNAAHIVRCVNLHDELVAVLEKIHSYYSDFEKYPLVPVAELRLLIEQALEKVRK